MKFVTAIINSFFILVVLAVAGLFLLPLLPIDYEAEIRIVQSGSMEPTIETGSLIFVWPQAEYGVGDVIMFADRNADVPTTHRIIGTVEDGGETRFVTQGDANEDPDNNSVAQDDVFGVVSFAVPKVGYVLDFARQPLGFIFLIVLPALLLILGEVEKIWKELRGRRNSSVTTKTGTSSTQTPEPEPKIVAQAKFESRARSMMDIMTPVRFANDYTLDLHDVKFIPQPSGFSVRPVTTGVIAGVVGIVVLVAAQYLSGTYAYFNDTEISADNLLTAIALDFTAVADGEIYTFENGELVADDDGSIVTMVMPEPDSDPVHYDVSAEFIGGNPAFCSAIMATSTSPVSYAGPLPLLSDMDVLFDAPWSMALALPDETGLFNGEICQLDIVLEAWHIDEDSGEGYTDEERLPLFFTLISSNEAPAFASTFSTLAFSTLPEDFDDDTSTSSASTTEQTKTQKTGNSTETTSEESTSDSTSGDEENEDSEEDEQDETITILVTKQSESEEEDEQEEESEESPENEQAEKQPEVSEPEEKEPETPSEPEVSQVSEQESEPESGV